MTETLLRKSQLLTLIPVAKSTLHAWLDPESDYYLPSFPRPRFIGNGRIPFFVRSEIEAWIAENARVRAHAPPDEADVGMDPPLPEVDGTASCLVGPAERSPEKNRPLRPPMRFGKPMKVKSANSDASSVSAFTVPIGGARTGSTGEPATALPYSLLAEVSRHQV